MVPLWLFLLVFVVGALGWVLFLFGWPPPLPDKGFRIITCPDEKRRRILLDLLAHWGGHHFKVKFRDDSPGIFRSFLWDGITLVNSTTKQLFEDRPNPVFTIAIPSRDPIVAAGATAADFRKMGYIAVISRDVDPTIARMDMVCCDELPGIGILFRHHTFWVLVEKIRKAIGS